MGYACPVCDTPQRDGEHLANHLAFTAMLGDDDHEAWLDDHAPDWESQSPDELGPQVVDHAPETEYEEVFEDTVAHRAANRRTQSGEHDHGDSLFDDDHDRGPGRTAFDTGAARQRGGGDLDDEAREILQEAQEMTRELLDDDESDESAGDVDGGESTDDGSASGSTDDGSTSESTDDGTGDADAEE